MGREEGENRYLEGYRNSHISLHPVSHRGPLALIDGHPSDADLELAASIVGRYSQGKEADEVTVEVRFADGGLKKITVAPLVPNQINPSWHV